MALDGVLNAMGVSLKTDTAPDEPRIEAQSDVLAALGLQVYGQVKASTMEQMTFAETTKIMAVMKPEQAGAVLLALPA